MVPAHETFVPVVRALVAAAAARLDIGYDEVDELRLAMDEAAAHLLTVEPRGTTISVRIAASADRFEIVASVDSPADPWPAHGALHTLTWQILSGLADEARFETAAGMPAIRFVKRVAARLEP